MPSSTKTVIALNGFLGRTTDWSLIEDLLPKGWRLHAVDLWTETAASFETWASHFTDRIASEFPGPNILLGYSMGGRLALHALAKSPSLFAGAVIVSAHPGLLSDEDRCLRKKADEVWASKFLREPWGDLMREWNAQAALREPKEMRSDSIRLERRESEFDRQVLAQALRTWSLGAQRNLRPEIERLSLPIEFITGQDDVKFTTLIRDWVSGERGHTVIPNAGHRVPWDAPAQFRASLAKFLSRW